MKLDSKKIVALVGGLLACSRSAPILFAQNPPANPGNPPPLIVLQPGMATPDEMSNPSFATGIQPAHDRDAESWLRRAAEAADRKDWKLVADTLERIIRDQGSTLVQMSDGTFRSAIEIAQAQIASLPPDGLEAYRILFDPTAKRLLEQARELHDLNPLREIARIYPQTSYGPEAIDVLTARLLDSMNAGEALAFLNQLEAMRQDRVSKSEIDLRRAVAFSLLRRPDRALKVLDAVEGGSHNGGDIAQRIAAVRQFVTTKDADRLSRSQDSAAWTSRMGPTSVGIAEALNPLILSDSGSRAVLPSKDKADPIAFRRVCQAQGRTPVWQVVTDGIRVFVTCPVGLIALDPATFDILWEGLPPTTAVDQRIMQHRILVQGFGTVIQTADDDQLLDDYTTTSLFREYRGAVTTAHGLVFILGQDSGNGERNPTRDGVPVGQYDTDLGASDGNKLLAYDAESGLLIWERGGGVSSEGTFADVRFYSTPIAYGDNLLVTYVRNGDLYLGEMNCNGGLVKEVAIGTGRSNYYPTYGLLEPTIANGSVYVPSGAGLLTALYAHDLSLRWLARYDRVETIGANGYDRPGALMNHIMMTPLDEWLSTPPVQAGPAVIVGPHDSDQLLAFDSETGVELWSKPRGPYRYVVGATDDLVVLAGKGIAALRVADGTTAWSVEFPGSGVSRGGGETTISALSGRPLLFEDGILVPTFNGMLKLDLETGRQVGDRVGEGVVLGNLGAFDGMLYSLGNTSIWKYPDPVRAQELALARLERDPNDVPALQRLAWLASLRFEWQVALDWLDKADAAIESRSVGLPTTADAERAALTESSDRVSHCRVDVLIGMAGESDDDTRSKLLASALAAARLPVDRTTAGLALASHEFATGREHEAGQLCIDLLGEAQGRPMQVGDHWRIQDALEIGRRLQQFYIRSSTEEKAAIEEGLNRTIAQLTGAGDKDALVRLSDALGFVSLGARLDLKIADMELNGGLIESAVHHLDRAIARASDPDILRAAIVRNAIVCIAPPEGIRQDEAEARRLLQRLRQDDPAISFTSLAPSDTNLTLQSLGDFIEWCESRLPAARHDRLPAILSGSDHLALITEAYTPPTVDQVSNNDVASFWDPGHPYRVASPVIPVHITNQYRGIRSDARDLNPYQWLYDPDPVAKNTADDLPLDGVRRMAVEGRVAVLVGAAQVEAVGLETGRAIWTPIPLTRHLGSLPDPPVVSAGGVAVVATDPNTIVAACVRDGAAPLWRRTFPDRQLGALRIVDGRLLCIDSAAHRAVVLELETGLLLREYDIPVGGKSAVEAAEAGDSVFGDMSSDPRPPYFAICGSYLLRTQGSRVLARRATTGEVAWELDFPEGEDVRGIGALSSEYAAIYHGNSGVRVISPATGHEVADIAAVGFELPPLDAVVAQPSGEPAPRLLMFTRMDDDLKTEYALSAYSLADGSQAWWLELGGHVTISPQMMRASPDYLAVVTNPTVESEGLDANGRKRLAIDRNSPGKVFIVNTKSGRRLGPTPYYFAYGRLGGEPQEYERESRSDMRPPFNRSREIRDVIVLDQRIIAFAPEGIYVLADEKAVESAQASLSAAGQEGVRQSDE